ncbi:MAG: hypothetical protein JWN48_1630 [Myxococcaceae bacterium]|nr:hypothetical protein [Myxococcaceae bacterium]
MKMSSRSTRHLSRRTLLRGLLYGSAVGVALPTLDWMLDEHGTALADGAALPKRFGVFFWGNGVRLDKWTPATQGAGYALTESLKPLINVKDYVSVVSGFNIKSGNERGHHAGCVGILSGSPMVSQDPNGAPYNSTFSAPSIDQVVASAITAKLKYRSLELGISKNVTTGEGTTLRYLSHNGPNNPNPPEYTPSALFAKLFGSGFTSANTTKPVDPKLALRRSVLDAVAADISALQKRLGKNDQLRMDQHLTSIRALENQILAIETAAPPPSACAAPRAPTAMLGDSHLVDVNQAMASLCAMALACDQTRVFSMLFSGSVGGTSYPELMASNHHGLTHDEAGDQPTVQAITTFIVARFAALLETLKGVPEGAGTLLDNCVIMASSDTAEGLAHSINDYPILVAGGGGGALKHPGVHFRGNGTNTSDVLLTLLQALDLPITSFGNAGGQTSTTVSALRA